MQVGKFGLSAHLCRKMLSNFKPIFSSTSDYQQTRTTRSFHLVAFFIWYRPYEQFNASARGDEKEPRLWSSGLLMGTNHSGCGFTASPSPPHFPQQVTNCCWSYWGRGCFWTGQFSGHPKRVCVQGCACAEMPLQKAACCVLVMHVHRNPFKNWSAVVEND